MHTLIALLTLVIVAGGSYLQLRFLTSAGTWRSRLPFYLFALATPALILGLMFISFCWKMIPGWDGHLWDDHSVIHLMAWSAAVIAVGAAVFSLVQRILLTILVRRYPKATDPALISLADRVAARLGVSRPTLRIANSAYPVALLGGVMGVAQYLLVSSWVISNLDEEEKEAVLAHELAHIRRRDELAIWIAQLLRNIAFYIPTLWQIWRRLEMNIQMDCDELASKVTGKRLALASALLKAGKQALWTRVKPRWALDGGLLNAFPHSGALGERVTLLMGETREVTLRKRPRLANFGGEFWVAIIALQGLAMALSFKFLCCTELHEHPIMVVAIFALSGLFLGAVLLRFAKGQLET
ncbi:MAG: M56 family metallopeptidase [Chloroflexota bacterium]